MKTIFRFSTAFLFLLLTICSLTSYAQFEQKFTLQTALGYQQVINPESFSSVFKGGFSFDAGAQFNFNRSLSLVALAKYSKLFPKDNSYLDQFDVKFNLLGISLCPKYRFL